MMDENRAAAVKSALQKFGLPTAAGVVGTGVGLILTRKPSSSRDGSDAKGIGTLVDDLKSKLESVIGKTNDDSSGRAQQRRTQNVSAQQLAERRRAREQRRNQRRSRARR